MRISGLNLRDFEYVIAVSELGSFVRAAERCHISQPSLSIQVAKLEDRLGTVIFERANRRNIVTREGLRLIDQMRKVISEVDSLVALTEGTGVPLGGMLRLSAITTLGPYYFPHAIQGLRRRFPNLAFALGEGKANELLMSLVDGDTDAILISTPIPDPGIHAEPLFFEPFLMAGPRARAREGATENEWLRLDPVERLLLAEGHCLRNQVLAACPDVAVSNRHAASLETLKYMVEAGEGCTLVPALAAIDSPGLMYSAPQGDQYGRRIALAWRRDDPHTPRFREIARHLKAHRPASLRAP